MFRRCVRMFSPRILRYFRVFATLQGNSKQHIRTTVYTLYFVLALRRRLCECGGDEDAYRIQEKARPRPARERAPDHRPQQLPRHLRTRVGRLRHHRHRHHYGGDRKAAADGGLRPGRADRVHPPQPSHRGQAGYSELNTSNQSETLNTTKNHENNPHYPHLHSSASFHGRMRDR